MSAEHPRAGIVLRLVTATPGEPTARPVAPALDAALAAARDALAVEGIDDAASAGDAWSDRADDASRLARAAAVLLASLPRVPR